MWKQDYNDVWVSEEGYCCSFGLENQYRVVVRRVRFRSRECVFGRSERPRRYRRMRRCDLVVGPC